MDFLNGYNEDDYDDHHHHHDADDDDDSKKLWLLNTQLSELMARIYSLTSLPNPFNLSLSYTIEGSALSS